VSDSTTNISSSNSSNKSNWRNVTKTMSAPSLLRVGVAFWLWRSLKNLNYLQSNYNFWDARYLLSLDEPNSIDSQSALHNDAFDYHSKLSSTVSTPDTDHSQHPLPPPIFYNVYVPHDPKGLNRAKGIIQEQLETVAKRIGKQQDPKRLTGPIHIFYQTINNPELIQSSFISNLCEQLNLHCHHLAHLEKGFEDSTLHHVHQFCLADAHFDSTTKTKNQTNTSSRRILYMHNKGSYHEKPGINAPWRQNMMTAITDPRCLYPPDDTCNHCSYIFAADRGFFSAGNMFTARCDYIRKLLPPMEFAQHMERVVKEALFLKVQGKMTMDFYKPFWTLGVGRYANEYWSGSHPDLRPCDFSSTVFFPEKKREERIVENTDIAALMIPHRQLPPLQWNMAPYHDFIIPSHNPVLVNLQTNITARIPEYFFLAGNILRWQLLYGTIPDKESFVWKWFPDGELWWNAVQEHGPEHALGALTGSEDVAFG